MVVPKEDGAMRFCFDYCKPNAVTIRDSYPLPWMNEYIDSLGDATVFTTLYCIRKYWQVEISGDDLEKTTCTSHSGLNRFVRIKSCSMDALATF